METRDYVREALQETTEAYGFVGTTAVLRFLREMDTNYVGDMYLEQSLRYLRDEVESILKDPA